MFVCRGLVAARNVSAEELRQTPLVVLPESAMMTCTDADHLLDSNKFAPRMLQRFALANKRLVKPPCHKML